MLTMFICFYLQERSEYCCYEKLIHLFNIFYVDIHSQLVVLYSLVSNQQVDRLIV